MRTMYLEKGWYNQVSEEKKARTPRMPKLWEALVTMLILVGALALGIVKYETDPHVPMFIGVMGAALMALYLGYKWEAIEKSMMDGIYKALQSVCILVIVGILIGVWINAGVVPTMIFYGLKVLKPAIFFIASVLICSITSLATGTSWGTMGTMGVALMGIGFGLGMSPGMTAGAVLSGAYFGDKISPLSETTILASSITDVPLFRHIRYMLITTTPSLIITLVIFTVMGFVIETHSTEHMADFAVSLKDTFTITPWLLIVPIVTGILIARKTPSIITLFLSTLLAGICAIIFQPELLREIAGESNIFKGVMMTFYGSTSLDTGNTMLTDLVSTRGMAGMMDTVWLILCAMCFGGAMTASGMLGSITSVFVRFMKGRVSVVASTVCSGLFLNLTTADQYISIILTGNMFRNIYEKKGYENRLLSRTTEDAVTVTSPLIPWNTCGMTQATILNVSTLTYLPYCFFNIISPLMSILVAAIGYKIVKRPVNNPE